jgi:histidyl-tRNA synthetase
VALLIDSLRAFGLTAEDFTVRLSSRNAWQDFSAGAVPSRKTKSRFTRPLTNWSASRRRKAAPNWPPSAFARRSQPIHRGRQTDGGIGGIVKNLAARGLGGFCRVDYHVIRGLAYYTGVVFEAFDKKGDFRAIAGGGRYDNLIKLISGGKVDLPALGFGMGDVVLLELLKARGLLPPFDSQIDAYCLIEDETLREASLNLVQSLREKGFAVEYSLTPAKSDKQFKRAMELKARFTVKLVAAAQGGLEIKLKNLSTREERPCLWKNSRSNSAMMAGRSLARLFARRRLIMEMRSNIASAQKYFEFMCLHYHQNVIV